MRTSEFVAQARDEVYLGHARGAFRNTQGVCVLGALDRVALRNLQNDGVRACGQARKALELQAKEMFPEFTLHGVSIPSINDDHSTTKQDILNWLDKTQISLEEKGL